jgi:hypothetical protein
MGSSPPPEVLKLDIEGAESDALIGASGVLRETRPTVFLATYGSEVHDSCLSILRRSGFTIRTIETGGSQALRRAHRAPFAVRRRAARGIALSGQGRDDSGLLDHEDRPHRNRAHRVRQCRHARARRLRRRRRRRRPGEARDLPAARRRSTNRPSRAAQRTRSRRGACRSNTRPRPSSPAPR